LGKNSARLTEHHLIPRSRGGPDEWWNKKEVPEDIHGAWHTMFANLRPEEVLKIIPLWTDRYGELNPNVAGRRNTFCWEIVFGKGAKLKRAVKIIKEKWFPDLSFAPNKIKIAE
jgi:hypothetical protein